MRLTQSFLLRLLIDPDCPHVLRGTLHVVADSQEFAFADERALFDLLHQLSARLAAESAIDQAASAEDRTGS
ncbi:MAG: hypothetical protein HY870_20950 [Chloroflexi bacterium]|nr:hypothetical protein [Chloroflexota bacterium]